MPQLSHHVIQPIFLHDALPILSVHGISRNADEHAGLFAPYASAYGVVLVAPCFTKEVQDHAVGARIGGEETQDRKSTRLNSSHLGISYAVFCLKKKNDNKLCIP